MSKVFNTESALDRAFREIRKKNCDKDLVLELIELIPENHINTREEKSGKSLLIYAYSPKDYEIAEKLLKYSNIDINIKDRDGRTVLICASWNNNVQLVKMLLTSQNIDVNAVSAIGSALTGASIYRYDKIVEILLAHPLIDVNMTTWLCSPLYQASMMGSDKVIEQLFNHPSIDVNGHYEDGMTPLMVASEKRR